MCVAVFLCFFEMKIVVNEIVASNLEDTGSAFDGQDPCVVMKIGQSTAETPRFVLFFFFYFVSFFSLIFHPFPLTSPTR